MGLVTCEKCKKIYDYEKYNGICPKCARYNRESSSAEDHQEYHNKYDGGYSHTAQDDHHSYHQKYDDNKNPHGSQTKMDKKTKTILGVIAFIFVINLLPFFGVLLVPVLIGAIVYFIRKNKK